MAFLVSAVCVFFVVAVHTDGFGIPVSVDFVRHGNVFDFEAVE